MNLRTAGLGVLGAIAAILGLLVLFWPGPTALSDRLAFALVFLIPGIIALAEVRRDLTATRAEADA